jgi:uncharacterized membrane protein
MKNTNHHVWKIKLLLVLAAIVLLQYCKPVQKTAGTPQQMEVTVTYEKDIKPIMLNHCTPCHFPEKGKKKMLDTYVATKENISEILIRIQLPTEDDKFMPFRSKMPPLSKEQIQLFKDWAKQGAAN